jgi:hypothetical protein
MKKLLKPVYLPYCTMILGALGCLCMGWAHATGVDQRMLLDPAHPGVILTWIFPAAMIAGAIVLVQPLTGKLRYAQIFPGSTVGAVGTAVSAVGIGFTAWGELALKTDRIIALTGWLGLISAVCLLYLAWCRYAKCRPQFWARSLVVVYLMLHMLCRYRVWSSDPELLRLFFDLAATVCFLLASYQCLAIEVELAQRRSYLCFSMLGAFFALAALPGSSDRVFLGAMAVWALTDRCSLRNRRIRKQEEV